MFLFWYLFVFIFGKFDIHAILYHWQFGFHAAGLPSQYIPAASIIVLLALCCLALWGVLVRRHRIAARVDSIAFLPLLFLNPLSWAVYDASGYSSDTAPDLYAHYKPAEVHELVGKTKRNILHIYLESAERTFLDNGYFVGAVDPLVAIEDQGFSATNISQVANTGWSIAGMIASTCGVPLVTPWLVMGSEYDDANIFLPSALCLPTILKQRGYSTHFMKGGSLQFADADTFLKRHGVEERVGLDDLLPIYPDRVDQWGVKDGGLFDALEKKYRDLVNGGKPFYLSALTIGGHSPDGYLANQCIDGAVELKAQLPIARGVECTNRLLRSLLDRLDQEGLLENTIVIIQNDHLAMKSDADRELNRHNRRHFFMALGPGIEPQILDRPASMMDVFPTILNLIGFDVEDGRAGIGVSLLSDKKTLMEQWGEALLSRSITRDLKLRDRLWAEPMLPVATNWKLRKGENEPAVSSIYGIAKGEVVPLTRFASFNGNL